MHANMNMEKNQWKVAEDDTVIVDPSDKEKTNEKHNWLATGIALMAITLVLLAVSTAAVLMGTEDEGAYWSSVSYDLNSVLDGESSIFIRNSVSKDQWKSTRWISDHQLVYWDASGGLSVYRAATNVSAVLVPAHVVSQWRVDDYWPSYDGRYVLLRQFSDDVHNKGELFHDCRLRQDLYAVYDAQENDLWKIRIEAEELQPTRLGFVGWSGRSSHLLAIYRNEIYTTSDATSRNGWQLLTENEFHENYEQDFFCVGLPDWTYSEGFTRAKSLMWPSISGEFLIYATLNSSECHRLDYIEYLSDHSRASSIRHAVPGGQLPKIQLKLIHLENKTESVTLDISQLANKRQWLLVQVEWLDATGFLTAWMTRNQNETRVFYCQAAPVPKCNKIIIEQAVPGHWLMPPSLYPSPSGNGFVMILDTDQVEDGQRLIYHQPPWQKTVAVDLRQLVVNRIVGWDESNSTTYLLCTPTDEPQKRHLYRVTGTTTECLTCHLPGDNCNYVDAKFEPTTTDYYELQCLGPHIPSVHVFSSEENEIVTTLLQVEFDAELRDLLEHLTPTVKYMTIPLEDGAVGRAQLLLPRAWSNQIYNKLRFPLIIQTLDWDEDDALTDQWRKDWPTYFSLTRQVIYARISAREMGSRYGSLQLGVDDLLVVTKFLLAELKHVNSESVVIIGKGTGGYLATMMMAKDTIHIVEEETREIFKCGIIVSPTIDWFRYELIAERYLGNVIDQQENYVLSKTDNHIHLIKNDTLLLMDSFPNNPVQHFQTMKFSYQLINAGIRFEYKTYPQASRKVIQLHRYLSLEHFITQCL